LDSGWRRIGGETVTGDTASGDGLALVVMATLHIQG
jgi:hypothetical protein